MQLILAIAVTKKPGKLLQIGVFFARKTTFAETRLLRAKRAEQAVVVDRSVRSQTPTLFRL